MDLPYDWSLLRRQCSEYFNSRLNPIELPSPERDPSAVLVQHGDDDSLRPNVLAIIAPMEKPGTEMRDREIKEYKFMVENFLKKAYGEKEAAYVNWKPEVVDTYGEMLEKTGTFAKSVDQNDLPLLLFMGHGLSRGELAFYKDRKQMADVLTDVYNIFIEKPADMRENQFRVIFSQCYAHRVRPDIVTKPGEVQLFDGKLEIIGFTGDTSPTTTSSRTYDHAHWEEKLAKRLCVVTDQVDVYMDLRGDHVFFSNAVADFKQRSLFKEEEEGRLKDLLRNQPIEPTPTWAQQTEINDYLNSKMRKIRILHISKPSEHQTRIENELARRAQGSENPCPGESVKSFDEMDKSIKDFLAMDLAVPVIVMTGQAKKVRGKDKKDDVYHIRFEEPETDQYKSVTDIAKEYIGQEDQVRLVFNLEVESDKKEIKLITNSPPPFIKDAYHVELKANAKAAVGKGPVNPDTKVTVPPDSTLSRSPADNKDSFVQGIVDIFEILMALKFAIELD